MAMGMSETDNGTKEQVKQWLNQISVQIIEEYRAELDAVWEKIRDLAIVLCPKESGALASSIELESEGGSGKVSASYGNEFYSNAIFAGNESTCNFDGQPTSQYALAVHEGHFMPNGEFIEGTFFLTRALEMFESELDAIMSKVFSDLGM